MGRVNLWVSQHKRGVRGDGSEMAHHFPERLREHLHVSVVSFADSPPAQPLTLSLHTHLALEQRDTRKPSIRRPSPPTCCPHTHHQFTSPLIHYRNTSDPSSHARHGRANTQHTTSHSFPGSDCSCRTMVFRQTFRHATARATSPA